jgi:uncharacterized membrane protein YbhN (UPF0104 family)
VTVFDDSSGWLADVVAQVGSVSVPLLVLALALQSGQTLLNAGAWWNVLRAAYPAAPPAYRQVLGAYGGGIALNVVLPAQGGTVAMLAFFRRRIAGATVLGLLGAAPVQSLFFIVVGGAVWAGLLASRPETFHLKYAWLYNHPALALAAAVVAAVVARAAWGRFRTRLAAVTEGGAVLRTPRRFVCGVLGLQFAAYVLRSGRLRDVHAGLRHSRLARLRAAPHGRQCRLLHILRDARRRGHTVRPLPPSSSGIRPRARPWPGTRSAS